MSFRTAARYPGRLAGGLILAAGLLFPSAPASAHSVFGALRPQTQPVVAHANQHQLLDLINAGRKRHGIKPLTLSLHESHCSTAHSRVMATANQLTHGLPGDICLTYTTAGENIGVQTGPTTAALAILNHEMWIEGPCPSACPVGSSEWEAHGHYLNMVDPNFTMLGIGVVYKNGNTWLTEDFTG